MDDLNLLSLMVALSAYLAGIRLAIVGRLGNTPPPKNPRAMKVFLATLVPADAPLVIGGLFLTIHLTWPVMFGAPASPWLHMWAVRLFVAGILVLAAHHAAAWIITLIKAARP